MNLFSKIKQLFGASEKDFKLTLTDEELIVCSPDGDKQRISWRDLEEVSVYSTEYSMFMPCMFWQLTSRTCDLNFPHRANGSKEVLQVIYNLEGFNTSLYSEVVAGRHYVPAVVWKKIE